MLHSDQIPNASTLIKTQHISLVWHIPACLLQKHIIFALMQKKSAVCSAQQAVGPRDLIEQIIIALVFSRVVNDNQSNIVCICKCLQRQNGFIIMAVAV